MRRYTNIILIFLLLFACGLADAQLRFSPGGVAGPQGETGPPGGGDGVEFDGTTHADFVTFLAARSAEETVVLPASLTFGSWTEVVIDKPLKFRGEGRKKVTWTGPGGVNAFNVQANVKFENIALSTFDDVFTFTNLAKISAEFDGVDLDSCANGFTANGGAGFSKFVLRNFNITNMSARGIRLVDDNEGVYIADGRIQEVTQTGISIGDNTTLDQSAVSHITISGVKVWDVDSELLRTGAGTSNQAYGIIIRGDNILITGCDVQRIKCDATEAGDLPEADAEGIYTKGRKVVIAYNYLKDAMGAKGLISGGGGTTENRGEAQINAKGAERTGSSPFGNRTLIIGNHLEQDEHDCAGINIAAENTICVYNHIEGLRRGAIVTYAGDRCDNTIINDNDIYDCDGDIITIATTSDNVSVNENKIITRNLDVVTQTVGIKFQSNTGAKNYQCNGNQIDIQPAATDNGAGGGLSGGILIRGTNVVNFQVMHNQIDVNTGTVAAPDGEAIQVVEQADNTIPLNLVIDYNQVTAGGDTIKTSSLEDADFINRNVRIGGNNIGHLGQSKHIETIADSLDGNPATLTLTPVLDLVEITNNDADGANVTMGEAGVRDGVEVTIVNVGTNPISFADTAGVSELDRPFTAGQYDSIRLQYLSDRWVERGRVNTISTKQAETIAVSGDGNPAAFTLTLDTDYIKSVEITNNDTDGANVTMDEANTFDGMEIIIINVGTNTISFADTAGVSELAGAFVAGQYDSIRLRYLTDRWVEIGRTDN